VETPSGNLWSLAFGAEPIPGQWVLQSALDGMLAVLRSESLQNPVTGDGSSRHLRTGTVWRLTAETCGDSFREVGLDPGQRVLQSALDGVVAPRPSSRRC
jgi:hypothetical protein